MSFYRGPRADDESVNLTQCPYDGARVEVEVAAGGSLLLTCVACTAVWSGNGLRTGPVREPDREKLLAARRSGPVRGHPPILCPWSTSTRRTDPKSTEKRLSGARRRSSKAPSQSLPAARTQAGEHVPACCTCSYFCKRATCRLRCRQSTYLRGFSMPRYRVTLRRSSVEIVEASNQYQAAIVARDLFGDSVEVADVTPAVGRPAANGAGRAARGRRRSRRSAGRCRRRRAPSWPRISSRPGPPARRRPEPPSARPRRRRRRTRQRSASPRSGSGRAPKQPVTARKVMTGATFPALKCFTGSIHRPIDNRHPYSVADDALTLCPQSGRLGSGERMAKPAP